MPLAWLLAHFQSLPLLPTIKLGPSGADSWVCVLVYILGNSGSLQQTLLWGWESFLLLQPPKVFTTRGFEALLLCAVTLDCQICLAPQLFLLVYLHTNVGPPGPPAAALPWVLLALAAPPPPLLPIWMNVSPLTPWLSDFHTIRFSSSSGYFLFLNLL